jgi:excisionase family DNA binding protein
MTSAVAEPRPLMSPEQAAGYLGVPVLTLTAWRSKRIGPRFYRVGRHVRYRLVDLDAWLSQHAGR